MKEILSSLKDKYLSLTIVSILFSIASFSQAGWEPGIYGKTKFRDSLLLTKYKNNLAGDSVLTTDVNGKVKLVLKSGGISAFTFTPNYNNKLFLLYTNGVLTDSVPSGVKDVYGINGIRIVDSLGNVYIDGSGISGGRFGIEDNLGLQDRQMQMGDNTFNLRLGTPDYSGNTNDFFMNSTGTDFGVSDASGNYTNYGNSATGFVVTAVSPYNRRDLNISPSSSYIHYTQPAIIDREIVTSVKVNGTTVLADSTGLVDLGTISGGGGGSGTVTSITAGYGTTGGTITTSGTIGVDSTVLESQARAVNRAATKQDTLSDYSVTAGTYTNITVNGKGLATAANNGVIQTYITGSGINVNDPTTWVNINPSNGVGQLNIVLPKNPANGQRVDINFGGNISSLDSTLVYTLFMQGPIIGTKTFTGLTVDDQLAFRYNSITAKWYRVNDIIPRSTSTPPAISDALVWLDGTIIQSGGNYYFKDQSGNGRNFLITGYDFDSSLVKGFPYKSVATISAPVGDAILTSADVDSFFYSYTGPNQIPVVSLFQDISFAHKFFARHRSQVLDSNGVETYEARVMDIVAYNTVKSGALLTTVKSYFGVPYEAVTNVKWVDAINGLDANAGTKAAPWKTFDKVQASVVTGDTVYFKTGNYLTTALYLTKTNFYQSLGGCRFYSTGTSRVVAIAAGNMVFNNMLFDGTADTNNGTIYHLGGTGIFNKCLFKNEKTNIVLEAAAATNVYNYCVFDSRLANTGVPLPLQIPTVNSCYLLNSFATNAGNATYLNNKFKQTRTTGQSGCVNFSGVTSIAKGNTFNYSAAAIGFFKVLTATFNKFYAAITATKGIGSAATTAELTAYSNTFYNNDLVITPTFAWFITLENPKSFDIQKNSFHSITKAGYYSIYIVTSSSYAITPAKINYNYVLNSSLPGTIITLNSELPYNNVFDNAEVIGNRVIGHRYLYPSDATAGVHGIFLNGGTNMNVKYNHVSHCELGFVIKNGLTGQAYTSNGLQYNKIEDCVIGIFIRGVKGLPVFNNTIAHSASTYARPYETAIKADTNQVLSPVVPSESILLKNNIYDIKTISLKGNIDFDAHASLTSIDSNSVMFGGSYALKSGITFYTTVALAQAAGKLPNCLVQNPLLSTALIPNITILTGLNLGGSYQLGLDISTWGGDEFLYPKIVTKNQPASGLWQVGAYVQ